MTARDDFPQVPDFAGPRPSGWDEQLIARRREAADVLDEVDRLRAARDLLMVSLEARTEELVSLKAEVERLQLDRIAVARLYGLIAEIRPNVPYGLLSWHQRAVAALREGRRAGVVVDV